MKTRNTKKRQKFLKKHKFRVQHPLKNQDNTSISYHMGNLIGSELRFKGKRWSHCQLLCPTDVHLRQFILSIPAFVQVEHVATAELQPHSCPVSCERCCQGHQHAQGLAALLLLSPYLLFQVLTSAMFGSSLFNSQNII